MNKRTNAEKRGAALPSAAELRKALAKSGKTDAMTRIRSLFDAKTFVELGAYTKRSFSELGGGVKDEEFAGVICGYGAVGGQLVFAFSQDASRMKGALDEVHAKKICALYDMAVKNGAPVVGIFDCAGADIFEGISALSGYGRIMKAVSAASGVIPQIALVAGNCIGSFAAIAAMFDMVITTKESHLYVTSPALTGAENAQAAVVAHDAADVLEATAYARRMLMLLPQNSAQGVVVDEAQDNLNRTLGELELDGDVRAILAAVADKGDFVEVGSGSATSLLTALTVIGGVHCGVVASVYTENEGRIDAAAARRAARFVDFCDAFALPVVTLVNSAGFATCAESESAPFAAELAKLAMAYARSENAKVTVVLGHAIGGAYTLLGSKSVGADVAYAFETAEIGALPAASTVAFALNEEISTSTSRKEVEADWLASLASPVAAASTGEIDDIIGAAELRQRICSALLLLAAKGSASGRRHSVLPL